MKIAITGATGFIGKHLIEKIIKDTDWNIVAISRNIYQWNNPRIEHRGADIFSLLETENALLDCDIAIYLVHSMEQTDRLSQGNFRDFDFLLADNFARAAEKNKIKKIIYIGGLIPQKEKLSPHLESRLEVEKILSSRSVPCLSLRCGLVIGRNSSSFTIMAKLVDRLPVMILPSWMESKLQPIDVGDLCDSVAAAIGASDTFSKSKTYDLCSDSAVTYLQLLEIYAKIKQKKLYILRTPFIPPFLTSLWISLISGKSLALVHPLIESICDHDMLSSLPEKYPYRDSSKFLSLEQSIKKTLLEPSSPKILCNKISSRFATSEVKSVQRLKLPKGKTATWVAEEYMRWLPKTLKYGIKVELKEESLCFRVPLLNLDLLILKYSTDRSQIDRPLFYIEKSKLVSLNKKARLEFRESPDKGFCITAIHNFKPALPWYLYRYSQAIAHKFIMFLFSKHLTKLCQSNLNHKETA